MKSAQKLTNTITCSAVHVYPVFGSFWVKRDQARCVCVCVCVYILAQVKPSFWVVHAHVYMPFAAFGCKRNQGINMCVCVHIVLSDALFAGS